MADFGPNSDAVESFLERIPFLEEGDALELAAAWGAADEQRRRLAWRAVGRVARTEGWSRALENAKAEIMSWSNRWSPLAAYGNPGAGSGAMRTEMMRGAVPALVDAVSALVMGGVIDSADFEALYEPFRAMDDETLPS